MKIGIVCAMPGEARTLTGKPAQTGSIVQINDHSAIVRSGVGPENAFRATVTLARQCTIDAVLSWGCAAGLHPRLQPGDTLLPDRILHGNGESLQVDRGFHQDLLAQLSPLTVPLTSALISSDQPVASSARKTALHESSGALALDMETHAIGLAARQHSLPFAALRAVLDPLDQTVPGAALAGLRDDGSYDLRSGLAALLRSPGELPAMLSLAASSFRAHRALRIAGRQLRTGEML